MPVDYKNSKIYRLVCSETGKQYIGSTTQPLYKRLHQHKKNQNKSSSKCLINPEIFLIENCSCNSKEELHKIERSYIESMDCVNIRIPTRTQKEHYQVNKEKIKEYQQINKESISKREKEYRKINKEIRAEKAKKKREINKEILSEKAKDYYQKKRGKKVKCECGSEITTGNLLTHKKTKKHIDKMNLL